MEPKTQVEIQLGHLCNNRCVFCVSGQETALGRARPLPAEPILREIRAARAAGHAKITLLGGEPTLQPAFLEIVRECVALGFEEIVLFTNGAKTARAAFVDEILATGGHFTFRFSLQGATEEAHERTTRKDGSFARLLSSMRHVHARGQRLTVNMCVVGSNYASVDAFPSLLLPLGASQLHLDMVRPLDAGQRTEAEYAAMIPRYRDLVEPMRAMVRGFPEGFDVNIGNLPYCVGPELSPWIHHDGEKTLTIAVDGETTLSKPWDKYLVKRRDKSKPSSCASCVMDARCNGVFEKYREMYGDEEFVPLSAERMLLADPERRLFSVHARAFVAKAFREFSLPSAFTSFALREVGERAVEVRLSGEGAPLAVELRPLLGQAVGQAHAGASAVYAWFSVWITEAPESRSAFLSGLLAIGERLSAAAPVVVPLGADLVMPMAPSIRKRLLVLRQRAPFGRLRWTGISLGERGDRAELLLEGDSGAKVLVWLGEKAGRPTGGYSLAEGEPTAEVVEGIRALMGALSPAAQAGERAPAG